MSLEGKDMVVREKLHLKPKLIQIPTSSCEGGFKQFLQPCICTFIHVTGSHFNPDLIKLQILSIFGFFQKKMRAF